ncbi:isocitrate lyase/phosphoenolpyruvate mutase family protein [Mycobacterium sp.]|uniref:isocitrate lyase/PEP mutase family protein n=1 Tax=Mycobacterium sp. TaxID=1785 RepID=UPI0025FB12A4|nr:isocitrate lyase/phosphoenolpyruvate mutase family protein [Mycobacterium sp.]MBW0015473.1 isocitrate lyase/phosphoenolpyruvate mutase family protein [Mycobacterium sp.]
MSFRALHRQGAAFVLPNAWDVPSALAFLADGFTAIGTTSFGVASSIGRHDGGRVTGDANLSLANALAPLRCHVSIDIEDGYSDEPDAVADYVARLPVAGINIEDSTDGELIDPALAAAKVAAIKQRNPEVFINARVDTYWLHEHADIATTIERALRYVEAGADGIFVPLANDRVELAELVRNIPRPLNTLPVPDLTLTDLGRLGVARVSTGSAPYRAASYAAAQVARAVRDGQPLPPCAPYEELQNRLIAHEDDAAKG